MKTEPKMLSRDVVTKAILHDEAMSLKELPLSKDLMASTRTGVSRGVLGIASASMPPTMHPDYELVTVWRRQSQADRWAFHERWIRAPGTVMPLLRLDEHFSVLRGEH